MSIGVEKLAQNPYLFANYVHQEVGLPAEPEFMEEKRNFYERVERMMESDAAQKSFENIVEDKENLGFTSDFSTEDLRTLHFQEAIDAVANEANKSLIQKYYQPGILKASQSEYQSMTENLDPGNVPEDADKAREIEGQLGFELRMFQEGLANALDFIFGLISSVPKAFENSTGRQIKKEEFKDIISRNIKVLNNFCGMQIEILNMFKRQLFQNIHQKQRKLKPEKVELKVLDGKNNLVTSVQAATDLIAEAKEAGVRLPVFGCPVLRVKYEKEDIPFLDKMHNWIEDLVDKHIIANWDAIMANTDSVK